METKEKSTDKKEQMIPMNQFVDKLLLKGGSLEEIIWKSQAEAIIPMAVPTGPPIS